MKKYFFILSVFSLIFLSFKPIDPNDNINKNKKPSKKESKTSAKPLCNCGTVPSFSVSYSGSNAIVTWIAVPGAVTYTFGGYYSCGGGFVVCSTTNSATIFRSCGGTFRITANCDGNSSCGNVTCGGSPSSPGTF